MKKELDYKEIVEKAEKGSIKSGRSGLHGRSFTLKWAVKPAATTAAAIVKELFGVEFGSDKEAAEEVSGLMIGNLWEGGCAVTQEGASGWGYDD
jgi:hypothetical protein